MHIPGLDGSPGVNQHLHDQLVALEGGHVQRRVLLLVLVRDDEVIAAEQLLDDAAEGGGGQ